MGGGGQEGGRSGNNKGGKKRSTKFSPDWKNEVQDKNELRRTWRF